MVCHASYYPLGVECWCFFGLVLWNIIFTSVKHENLPILHSAMDLLLYRVGARAHRKVVLNHLPRSPGKPDGFQANTSEFSLRKATGVSSYLAERLAPMVVGRLLSSHIGTCSISLLLSFTTFFFGGAELRSSAHRCTLNISSFTYFSPLEAGMSRDRGRRRARALPPR
jgi:hypothetical protein